MINFDDYVNENKTEHKKNQPYIPNHPYRILTTGGSGSGKTNALLNLIELQQIETNHSSDISTKDFTSIYRECTAEPYYFLVNDTTLHQIIF